MLRAIKDHALREPQVECCGMLAGRAGEITHIFPATNAASSPATTYEIAPKEIIQRMREMRGEGLELLGIYHSHPNGRAAPSPTDIESAGYPDAAYFIVALKADGDSVARAFRIRNGQFAELEIIVL